MSVQSSPADLGKINPSLPTFGGPTGIHTGPTSLGDRAFTYGNSPLRGGASQLSPTEGLSVGDDGDGWSHTCYTASPGDSGSAVLAEDGTALGVLNTLAVAPLAASNGVGDLSRELDYLNAHGGLGGLSACGGVLAELVAVPLENGGVIVVEMDQAHSAVGRTPWTVAMYCACWLGLRPPRRCCPPSAPTSSSASRQY